MDVNVQYLASILDGLPPDESRLLVQFAEFLAEKQPRAIGAREARRQVSAWLVREVGNLLIGGQPEFVPGERPVWRVPVMVGGMREHWVDSIDVDARTGELMIDATTPSLIVSHVQAVVGDTSPS